MKYRHVTTPADYTPYTNGLVLHSAPGHPPLPVRLASELFLRAYHLWGGPGRCTLYDPLCGSGATLVTLKFLHWELIDHLTGSDIDPHSLEIAGRNFQLLTPAGMQARINHLQADAAAYGKPSHQQALAAAYTLRDALRGPAETTLFPADATDPAQIQHGLAGQKVDIVLLDIPYGSLSNWQGQAAQLDEDATPTVLNALRPALTPRAVICLVMPKKHNPTIAPFHRHQRLKIGKREAWILGMGRR